MIENPNDYFHELQKMPEQTNGKPLEDGAYFYVSGGQYKVIIIGNCPNLNNNECRTYPNHPPGCKKIRIDSNNCHQARNRDCRASEQVE